jgi:hypothetical protein
VFLYLFNKNPEKNAYRRPLQSDFSNLQVAAVLANMAANSECRGEVVRHGGLPILLQFLRSPVPSTHSKNKAEWRPEDFAQMAATERVLQKSAIAISRSINYYYTKFFDILCKHVNHRKPRVRSHLLKILAKKLASVLRFCMICT